QQDQSGLELGSSQEESLSFEELSRSMRRMGLSGDEALENVNFPSKLEFRSLKDLDAVSPVFRENFERSLALAVLAETRRSMKRIKDAYKG
ncbi:hypothetical protein, partial [Candidatus Similichlamydia laticola]|uniref:hypothetical protein n=1 Tax=Candidatus Similichlamydia laticola TaxID=2170265 RepID=UPI0015F02E41